MTGYWPSSFLCVCRQRQRQSPGLPAMSCGTQQVVLMGSQSQCAIWFMLPAHRASHIMMRPIPMLVPWLIFVTFHLSHVMYCIIFEKLSTF